MDLTTFDTWTQVLAHVKAGRPTWYRAPLDLLPTRVFVRVVVAGRVRVDARAFDCDPFDADADHLARFRRIAR